MNAMHVVEQAGLSGTHVCLHRPTAYVYLVNMAVLERLQKHIWTELNADMCAAKASFKELVLVERMQKLL